MRARRLAVLSILLLLPSFASLLAYAGGGHVPVAGFTMERAVVGAGGGHSASATAELDATAGQPAAGPAAGSAVTLVAGFWGALPTGYRVYLPLVLR